MITFECKVLRGFKDACEEFNQFSITGMINEVSPMESLAIAASVLYYNREKEKLYDSK